MAKRRTGKSGSKQPLRKTAPTWVKLKTKEVEKIVVNLAKQGMLPSKIGLILRDSYGIPSIKKLTSKSILRIMRENKIIPDMPEDLYSLLKKAVIVRKHLDKNKKDNFSKKGLILTESKIRKLGRYYVRRGVLPKDWKYDHEKAKLLVKT
jgi:small subunit ribosomal protein S15